MNAWIVIGIDGLIHLSSYVALSILLLILTRVIGRRKISIALYSAFFTIILIQVSSVFVQNQLGKFLPLSLDLLKIGLAALISLIIASQFVKWRLQASLFASAASVFLVIIAHFCASTYMPILSRQLMPEGPRFAQIGSHTKSEVKRIFDEAIKEQKETGEFSLIAKLGESFYGFKQITSKEESQSIGRDFKAGMDFIKERRAIMASMTEEEKRSYRESIEQFKREQGISNDPYSAESLARLKNIRGMEGIGSGLESAAYLKESGNLNMAGVEGFDGIMGQLSAGLASSDEFGLPSEANLIQPGGNLAQMEQLASSFNGNSGSISSAPINLSGFVPTAASQAAPYQLQAQRLAQQNFMAKDSQPELNYYALSGFSPNSASPESVETTKNANDLGQDNLSATNVEIEELEQRIELVDPDSLIPAITEKAIFRLPNENELWDEWLAAAKALPLEGFFVGVGSETTTIVIIRSQAVTLGETSKIRKNGKTYSFRVDRVDEGIVKLSAVSRS